MHIQEKWSIMTKPDCVPVHVALQLLDKSSLGRGNDYDDFQETSKALQKALKAIVNGTVDDTAASWFSFDFSRASSGLQQLHRNFPQDPIQHSNLSKPCESFESFFVECKRKLDCCEAGIERTCYIIPELR